MTTASDSADVGNWIRRYLRAAYESSRRRSTIAVEHPRRINLTSPRTTAVSLDNRWRRRLAAGTVAILIALPACREKEAAQKDGPVATQFADFDQRLDNYMSLRKRLVDSVGELDPSSSQEKIAQRANGLAQALIAARAQAKPGDIFTPEVATILATLIREEYSRRADTVLETREDTQDELPDFVPQVNQIYPTTYPLATFPPALLPLLPPLPENLEYRVVQNYLLLRDVEANVIIDFMPNAVPSGGAS